MSLKLALLINSSEEVEGIRKRSRCARPCFDGRLRQAFRTQQYGILQRRLT